MMWFVKNSSKIEKLGGQAPIDKRDYKSTFLKPSVINTSRSIQSLFYPWPWKVDAGV
jgi:hypothetical protein